MKNEIKAKFFDTLIERYTDKTDPLEAYNDLCSNLLTENNKKKTLEKQRDKISEQQKRYYDEYENALNMAMEIYNASPVLNIKRILSRHGFTKKKIKEYFDYKEKLNEAKVAEKGRDISYSSN